MGLFVADGVTTFVLLAFELGPLLLRTAANDNDGTASSVATRIEKNLSWSFMSIYLYRTEIPSFFSKCKM